MLIIMWTVVYMAQSQELVKELQQVLEDEGLLVMIRPVNKSTENENTKDAYYEVLVPESEVEEAHSIIIDTGF